MYRKRFKRNWNRFKRGVPRGYKHKWHYNGQWNETKIGPGTWKGRFKATKTRRGSGGGGLGIGQRIKWKIWGIQTATKVGGRKYLTDFKFKKKMVAKPTYKRRKY